MKSKHPYAELENTQLCTIIEEILIDLIENQDIDITTRKENVKGYIRKNLGDNFKSLQE